jgi:hypothetical protein
VIRSFIGRQLGYYSIFPFREVIRSVRKTAETERQASGKTVEKPSIQLTGKIPNTIDQSVPYGKGKSKPKGEIDLQARFRG